MELKIDLSKVLYRADQVEVGKEYYLFYRIEPKLESEYLERGVINSVTDDPDYPFESNDTAYTYAYPVPEKKKRLMTFDEFKTYWMFHRTEIYHIESVSHVSTEEDFMISSFRTEIYPDGSTNELINTGVCYITYKEFIDGITKEDRAKLEIEED